MSLIDFDSHFTEPFDWLRHVDAKLAAEVKKRVKLSWAEQFFGEMLAAIPADERPPVEEFLPESVAAFFRRFDQVESLEELEPLVDPNLLAVFKRPGISGGKERIEHCDQRGIDVQVCSPGPASISVIATNGVDPALGRRVCAALNDWSANAARGFTDRLLPTALVTLDDVAWSVSELTRMRERGSRTWMMPLNPVQGRTLGDPAYDPLWAASLDLGIIPVVHIGLGWSDADASWFRIAGKANGQLALSTAGAMIPIVSQMVLTDLIYRGVFDRFPNLIIINSEFGLGWVDDWVDRVGPATRLGGLNPAGFFPWEHAQLPRETLERNLRFTPLRGQRVDEAIDKFGPHIVLFASDYPHPEGIESEWGCYEALLKDHSDSDRSRFFHENAAELLKA
ncbi:MAG: amidohydrolase family protein [Candidatus Binatia bacterium]